MARNKTKSTTTTTYTDKQGNVQTRESKTTTRSKTSSHGVSVGASTNAWGMVSLFLIIGLIATVFLAHYNSTNDSGVVQYFSPSYYLEKLSSSTIEVPEGVYYVHFEYSYTHEGLSQPYNIVRGYVLVDGLKFYSENEFRVFPTTDVEHLSFEFRFGKDRYYSAYDDIVYNGNHIFITNAVEIEIGEMPDFNLLAEKWSSVDGADSFFQALSLTGEFFVDWFGYQARMMHNLLPWNSIAEGNRFYLEDLWNEVENRIGVNLEPYE